jgi:hypothetical protein
MEARSALIRLAKVYRSIHENPSKHLDTSQMRVRTLPGFVFLFALLLPVSAAIAGSLPAEVGITDTNLVAGPAAAAPPVLSSITPPSALVGSPNLGITVSGTGFDSTSTLTADGYETLTTHVVSATKLTATVPAALLTAANPVSLVASSMAGTSNTLQLAVLNPVPVIHSLSPATVTAGAPDFPLTISASGLVSASQVFLNGVQQQTFSGAAGTLVIEVDASRVTSPGTLTITVTNPAPGGGTATAKLSMISGANRLRTAPLSANALVWDPSAKHIYASIPANGTTYANRVVAVDPASGAVVGSQRMPAAPTLLSITDDQQYLYVAMPSMGEMARLKLPGLTPDIQWSINPGSTPAPAYGIADVEAAPGYPHTVAITQTVGYSAGSTLVVYDDGVARAQTATGGYDSQESPGSIQWGANASKIYGSSAGISGGMALAYRVNASGVSLEGSALKVFASFASILYDRQSAHLFDNFGDVVDSATGRELGRYSLVNTISYEGNVLAVDSTLKRVFFINGSPYAEYQQDSTGTQIQVFDEDTYAFLDSMFLPSTAGAGADLIRWGSAGLAFATGGTIYMLDGPFVAPGVAASSAKGGFAVAAPSLANLSPESAAAGSAETVVTLTGANFTASTEITWNGNLLAGKLLSATSMQVTLPAALLASPTAGPVFAVNDPQTALSNPLAFTVLPKLGEGMQLAALNLSGEDLVWDSTTNLLYEAVAGSDLVHGNTIASIDPVAEVIKATAPAASSPDVLAISGNDQYLYVGAAGTASIERYALPAMTPSLAIPLGAGDTLPGSEVGGSGSCDFAVSIEVAPNAPETIAVSQGSAGFACGAVAIFDSATPRNTVLPWAGGTDFSYLAWGPTDSVLYAQSDAGYSDQYISSLAVTASGVTRTTTFLDDNYLGYKPHFDPGTGYIFSDGGAVTRPSDGKMVGNFEASGLMVPDSKLNRAYFLGQTPNQNSYGQNSTSFTLQIFNLKTYALLNSIVIPSVIGYPIQLVRWGASGIAFTTENGDYENTNAPGLTYILSGPLITAAAAVPQLQGEHVRLTWPLRRVPSRRNRATE